MPRTTKWPREVLALLQSRQSSDPWKPWLRANAEELSKLPVAPPAIAAWLARPSDDKLLVAAAKQAYDIVKNHPPKRCFRHRYIDKACAAAEEMSNEDIQDVASCLGLLDPATGTITGNKKYTDFGIPDPAIPTKYTSDYRKLKESKASGCQKLCRNMEAFYTWTRTPETRRRLHDMGIKGGNPSHCFGIVMDVEPNPMGQACHVDGKRGEGQILVHFRSKQTCTKVYGGRHPSMEELCEQAGIDEASLRSDVKEVVRDTTWAFLGKSVLDTNMVPVHEAEDVQAGDVTILAGPVPHAGPPTKEPRILGFCAVGGTQEHDSDEQYNPWNVAAMMVSPRCLQVAKDYWEHKPHMAWKDFRRLAASARDVCIKMEQIHALVDDLLPQETMDELAVAYAPFHRRKATSVLKREWADRERDGNSANADASAVASSANAGAGGAGAGAGAGAAAARGEASGASRATGPSSRKKRMRR